MPKLGMRLQIELRQARKPRDAARFELLGPFEIGQLIEPRHHLDHDGDALPASRAISQRLNKSVTSASVAVERPFDGHDIRVRSRLPDILQDDISNDS